jgi:imidazolonepropionase-like amidohydrolase
MDVTGRLARGFRAAARGMAGSIAGLLTLAQALVPTPSTAAASDGGDTTLLRPARVFTADDGVVHPGWVVLVTGARIAAVGPAAFIAIPADAKVVDLPGETLLPGLIDAHSHLFLHPYDETSWDDQVLKEPLAYRTLRAGKQATATLMAGFTTLRDLGTEGAGDADVGLKRAIEDGIVVGPRLSPPAPSWRPAPTDRRGGTTPLAGTCRRARRKPPERTR